MGYFREKVTDQSGFSLIEAMVAIAIFAIGILGAYQMQIRATAANAMANRVSTAANWATYVAEELLTLSYDELVDGEDDGIEGLDDGPEDADGVRYIQPDGLALADDTTNDTYTVYWNIAEGHADDEPAILEGVKQIRVHVRRNGGIGAGLLYTHDYYRAKWPESDE